MAFEALMQQCQIDLAGLIGNESVGGQTSAQPSAFQTAVAHKSSPNFVCQVLRDK